MRPNREAEYTITIRLVLHLSSRYMRRSSLAKYEKKIIIIIIYEALREGLWLGVANEALEITFIINCANLILLNKNNTYWGTQLALIKLDILIWKMCWGKQAFSESFYPWCCWIPAFCLWAAFLSSESWKWEMEMEYQEVLN